MMFEIQDDNAEAVRLFLKRSIVENQCCQKMDLDGGGSLLEDRAK